MRKILIILVLLLLCFAVTVAEEDDFSGYGLIGLSVLDIDGEKTTSIKFEANPEFKLGKFEAGINTSLFVNENGIVDINLDGEKDIDDLEFRLRYLGWDGEMLKLRYGEIDDLSLGNGSIIYCYSNNKRTSFRFGLHHPERKYGMDIFAPLNYDINMRKIDDKEKAKTIGARIYIRPLQESYFLDKMELGLTVGYDKRDRYNKFYNTGEVLPNGDTVGDEKILKYKYKTDSIGNLIYDENGDPINELMEYDGEVMGVEASISFPIIEDLLIPYYSYSKIYGTQEQGYNSGELRDIKARGHFTGIMGNTDLIKYKAEIRKVSENFVSGYFGRFYEQRYNEYMHVLMSEEASDKMTYGVFGDVSVDLFNILTAQLAYEEYKSANIKPHIYGRIEAKPFDKLKGRITYEQKDINNFEDKEDFLNENTHLKAEFILPAMFVGIPGPFILKAEIDQTYYYDNEEFKYFPVREYSLGFGVKW